MLSRVTIISVLVLSSRSAHVGEQGVPIVQTASSPALKPDYGWKSLFSEIDKRAKVAKLAKLDSARLPAGDLEVRVWYGFGLVVLEGFVIKRSAAQSSAIHLEAINPKHPQGKHDILLGAPKSGWDTCWQRLLDAGLLTLPDASQLGEEPIDPDVLSYVVEYNDGGKYRTYHYTNPEANDRKEAKQMIAIGKIIFEEFGLPQFLPFEERSRTNRWTRAAGACFAS
jgi:hypothetical protein